MLSKTPRLVVSALAVFCWLACYGPFAAVFAQQPNEADLLCMANYAKFNRNHTACQGPNGCKITNWGVSKAEQKQIVDIHNYYRNLVAGGNETQLGFPSASNMLKMEWDPELAYVAQMHANQCQFAHDCYDCRRTDRYEFVGQNLYTYQTTRSTADIQWPFVVKEWYDEIKIAPPVVAQSFDLFNLNIGHFTQIAWASTNRVGCGYVTYDLTGQEGENSIFKTGQLYTCNYAPGGNFLGEKMYEEGHAASQCPARYHRSKRFASLCEFARKTNKNVARKKTSTTKQTVKLTSTTALHPVPSFSNSPNPAEAPIITTVVENPPQIISHPPTTRTTTTTTTRRLITTSITKPLPSSTVTTSRTTSRPTFTLKAFSVKPRPTTDVTRTSKRVTNWWDKWSNNFANSLTSSTARPVWKSSWTFSQSTKPARSTSSITTNTKPRSVSWTSKPASSTGRFLRIEMSQNGTTTQRINQPI